MKLYICTSYNVTGIETIQAGLVLRHFFLCIFTVMRLENVCHLSHLHDNFQFNTFRVDDLWPHLSSLEGY